ncbi:UDP-N-acetyl-D-glucosamine 6-dehydrogenase [bioreactor metagenome]|uniref:UDP-N-acetyl-D-glucosamine 6-dehydrogenase n=1 Tax=bioreactor metagenome TaxID=1076179 RepID=A0A644XZ72_9ZZZZ
MDTFRKLLDHETKLSVIGLGYVGLPIALEFAKTIDVIGFDIKPDRVELMKNNIDPSDEIPSEEFLNKRIVYTSNPDDLKDATFHIVAVPTPIDNHNLPDLTPLVKASETVGKILKKGDTVVFESTVYPGATEEDCIPIMEKHSGLKFPQDFNVGYSPERINPGDKVHTLTNTVKIVSGNTPEVMEMIASTYELVIKAGVHRAPSIKVAEAAKIIENTQRDINIGLMNELSIIFGRMGINTLDVLEAAGTKWNFLKFQPGLVGGHCIGVDPYYLVYKAQEYKYHPQIIRAGRFVNDSMGSYVAKQCVKRLIKAGKNILDSKVLVMGVTFKENVTDIRNSKVVDIINELISYGLNVDAIDPHADASQFEHEYNMPLASKPQGKYDAIVLAVMHDDYMFLDEEKIASMMKDDQGVLIDVKGILRHKIHNLTYWSL